MIEVETDFGTMVYWCTPEALAVAYMERWRERAKLQLNFPVPVLAKAKDSGRVEVEGEARESTVTTNDTTEAVEESRGGEKLSCCVA